MSFAAVRRAPVCTRSKRRSCGFISAIVIIGLLGACGASDYASNPPSSGNWFDERTPSGYRELAAAQTTCRDCLTFELVANLTGEGESEALPYGWQGGAVDRNGNIWVGQGGMVRVFDPQGMFVRDIGRSGQGPFEFKHGRPVYSDANGNVHIYDLISGRETIIRSDDFTLVDMRPAPALARDLAPLPNGRYVMAKWAASTERIGFPLHIVDGTKIIQSFGLPTDADQRPLTRFNATRLVTTDTMGHILSVEPYRYLVEAWTMAGARILGLEGPELNDHEIAPGGWSVNNPPPQGWIFDIRVYDGNRLFVLSYQRKENWLDAAREVIRPNGNVAVEPASGLIDDFYTSRIDAIDLSTGTLIASGTHERILGQFLDNMFVSDFGATDEGDWQVAIWRMHLVSN